MTKPVMVPARRRGIDCAVCGQYGLGVREISRTFQDGAVVRTLRTVALACCYCKFVIRLGGGVDTYPSEG